MRQSHPGATSLTRASPYNPLKYFLQSTLMLPQDQENSGEGTEEVIAEHWSRDPDGHHLAKDSFWTILVTRNPWNSGLHSKKIWICRSTVGTWNESLPSSLFFLFLPPNPRSGALRSRPHTHHTWDLSVGEDLRGGGFLRDVKARIRQRKYLGFSLYTWPWVKCSGLPRLSVDFSIQTKTSRILVSS